MGRIVKYPVETLAQQNYVPRRPEKFEIFFKSRAGIDEALGRFADEILKAERECKDPLFFAYTRLSAHNDALKSILKIMGE